MRLLYCLLLALSLPFAQAQSDLAMPIQVPLSFEAELDACIAADLLNRGIGADCINLSVRDCAEQRPSEFPEGSALAALWCLDRATTFWDERLNAAYSSAIAAYDAKGVGGSEMPNLALQLRDVQRIWIDWREAKCAFLAEQDNTGGQWRRVDQSSCRFKETAIRALEMEQVNRLASD